jgi:hypothetical protein
MPTLGGFALCTFKLDERRIMDSEEAEARARQFIKQRHSRVERIFFRTMYREENTWILHGEVSFKRAYFFSAMRSFEIKVNTDTGEVVSYEETQMSQSKEAK